MKRSLPIVLVLMMLLAAACQKSVPVRAVQTQTQAEAPREVITLKLGYRSSDFFASGFDQLGAAFAERYPHYRIQQVELPPFDQRALFDERVQAGEYDLIVYTGVADPGLLEPLDAYLDRSQPAMARVAAAADSMRISGRLHQIPILLVPHAFLVNLELWEAAGLPLPASGWSWNEFREAAARLTRGDGASRIWGFNTDIHEDLLAVYLMEKTGKSFWLAEEKDLREAMHFFTGMVQTDRSLPPPTLRDWGSTIRVTGSRHFEKRQAALEYRSLLALPAMNKWLGFPWDIAPVPVGPGQKPIMFVNATSLLMAANSGQKDAAWEFIRFAAGPEGAATVAASGAFPIDGSTATKEAWAGLPAAPPSGALHLFDTPWVTTGLFEGNPGKVAMELYRLANQSLRGEIDPDTAVTQFLEFRRRYVAD